MKPYAPQHLVEATKETAKTFAAKLLDFIRRCLFRHIMPEMHAHELDSRWYRACIIAILRLDGEFAERPPRAQQQDFKRRAGQFLQRVLWCLLRLVLGRFRLKDQIVYRNEIGATQFIHPFSVVILNITTQCRKQLLPRGKRRFVQRWQRIFFLEIVNGLQRLRPGGFVQKRSVVEECGRRVHVIAKRLSPRLPGLFRKSGQIRLDSPQQRRHRLLFGPDSFVRSNCLKQTRDV